MAEIAEEDLVRSIADAFQYISYFHPPDFIRYLAAAWEREESPAARNAMSQILVNARMAALGRRPICQDTGTANVFIRIGAGARIRTGRSLQQLVDAGVREAYTDPANPLRASIVSDPFGARTNSGDNTPAVVHVQLVEGDEVAVDVSAKGGGSENKSRFAVLEPSDSVSDWVVGAVESMGAGWCPPGILGIGVGGSVEKAMLLAKESLNEPLDMAGLLERGPASPLEALRLEIYERVNALGIGAQGLGGMTTVLDVRIRAFPTHATSLPLALVPNCAATRHVHFVLDGSGPARLASPNLDDWPQVVIDYTSAGFRRVDLDHLTDAELAAWRPGQSLLLSGTLYTGRDAAHKRMVETLRGGGTLPMDLRNRAIYYVGPVDAVAGEVIGPAGPTTATRMDRFTDEILEGTGLKVMIGKAERGAAACEAIARHRAPYLIATGGAAYLISKSVESAKIVAYEDLGMEAMRKLKVRDMPVTVAVDVNGSSVHASGPAQWRLPVQARP